MHDTRSSFSLASPVAPGERSEMTILQMQNVSAMLLPLKMKINDGARCVDVKSL